MENKGLIDVFASEVVGITVWKHDKQKKVFIHKELFARKAPVFFKMFRGSFKEGITGLAALPDDSLEAFEVFAKWLYLSMVTQPIITVSSLFTSKQSSEGRWKMVETIAFADKYCLDELSDMVMSSWFEDQPVAIPLKELEKITSYVLANSSNLCKARGFFALMWASKMIGTPGYGHSKPNEVDLDTFIKDDNFAKQVIIWMNSLACHANDGWHLVCDYHLHDKSVPCHDSNMEVRLYLPKPGDTNTLVPNPAKKRKLSLLI
ncbi:hypothetical protein V500_05992 [Pseudogymnoascus sp. VKM F-4518 (FW-2643)]|nr:hypothetical protein V500_05992 [Pseudogymnoascus sp. VKM F-4518 (FW-2643)]